MSNGGCFSRGFALYRLSVIRSEQYEVDRSAGWNGFAGCAAERLVAAGQGTMNAFFVEAAATRLAEFIVQDEAMIIGDCAGRRRRPGEALYHVLFFLGPGWGRRRWLRLLLNELEVGISRRLGRHADSGDLTAIRDESGVEAVLFWMRFIVAAGAGRESLYGRWRTTNSTSSLLGRGRRR